MTPPVAFDLFWFLPTELRRYIFSRFLTDSMTLEKILRVAINADSTDADAHRWDATVFPDKARVDQIVGQVEQGLIPNATRLLAGCASISEQNARRIIADPGGEPLSIAFKAMGVSRARFSDAVERWRVSPSAMLRHDRNIVELQNLFDSLSFNKARVVLTYWDWLARASGPYAEPQEPTAA
jgi:hypothetical protein